MLGKVWYKLVWFQENSKYNNFFVLKNALCRLLVFKFYEQYTQYRHTPPTYTYTGFNRFIWPL